MNQIINTSTNNRREFIKNLGAIALLTAMPAGTEVFARSLAGNTSAKGYAAMEAGKPLSLWNFERRPVGDTDVQISIQFCGVCHSDIHTVRNEWGPQRYPLIPGHEIVGKVVAVGKRVTKFKIGDVAGVGCMVDSCGTCSSCQHSDEQYCDNRATVYTYGSPDKALGGVTQGGYSNTIVVKENFVLKIPASLTPQQAAPLLCAGVTTYSPMIRNHVKAGMKVGVAGIGGLGHMAIKIAAAMGARVTAFTTSPSKAEDCKRFGASEVVVVDEPQKLFPYMGSQDYMISTIPAKINLGSYAGLVRRDGTFTQVGIPAGDFSLGNFSLIVSRVNLTGSLIGGTKETQEILDYCALKKIAPEVEVIAMNQVNNAFEKVIAKEARYRYVLDLSTL